MSELSDISLGLIMISVVLIIGAALVWVSYNSAQEITQTYTTSLANVSCYQESANVSTPCGGLGNGSYDYSDQSGMFSPVWLDMISDEQNTTPLQDANWGTGSYSQGMLGGYNYLYINYSIPIYTQSATWKIEIKNGSTFFNMQPTNLSFTVPSDCMLSQASMIVEEKIPAIGANCLTDNKITLYCDNGTDWHQLQQVDCADGVYEEAMNWTIQQTIKTPVPNSFIATIGDSVQNFLVAFASLLALVALAVVGIYIISKILLV